MTIRPASMRQGIFVFIALLVHALMAFVAVSGKSATFDEPIHIAGGYSFWRLGDYRIHPENGLLPQRIASIPVAITGAGFSGLDSDELRNSSGWVVADRFMYFQGNDATWLLTSARAMMILVSMVLGAVIFSWAKRLFGVTGGWVSLLLYVFSPTFLAHGALATSDVTAALFFVAASWSLWIVMHRMTVATTLISVLCLGLLFVAKFSALLFLPMAVVMVAVRLLRRAPLYAGVRASTASAIDRRAIPGRLAMQVGIHFVGVLILIWAAYGFRYSMLSPNSVPGEKSDRYWVRLQLPHVQTASSIINRAREVKIVPEAWLIGLQHVLTFEGNRPSFLNEEFYRGGRPAFFPYAALVKTTIPSLVLLCLAPMFIRRRRLLAEDADGDPTYRGIYGLTPLLVLIGVYWAFALRTQLNIGHRHLMPAIAGSTVLLGAAGLPLSNLLAAWRRQGPAESTLPVVGRGWGWLTAGLLAWHAIESVRIAPNYIAYFNQLDCGPSKAYRHLIDSSLDWGQDLPQLKAWLDEQGLQGPGHEPVYLSFFGAGLPSYYGLDVELLPMLMGRTPIRFPPELQPGVYCISASMAYSVYLSDAPGPWTEEFEKSFQADKMAVRMWASASQTPGGTEALVARVPQGVWPATFTSFERRRLGRLLAVLRRREPDAQVGYSILIYRVSAEELRGALDGSPPYDSTYRKMGQR